MTLTSLLPEPLIMLFLAQKHKTSLLIFRLLCLLAYYLPQNAGDIARKFIKDPQLLSFIDAEVGWLLFNQNFLGHWLLVWPIGWPGWGLITNFFFSQCFIVSTINALQTPMINASMVIYFLVWPNMFCCHHNVWHFSSVGFMWQAFWRY